MSKQGTQFEQLRQKITDKTITVAIIGMGYVGLPLARRIHDAGISVIAFDIDEHKIELLQNGTCYLKHLGDSFVKPLCCSKSFSATTDPEQLETCDVIILCVPTPIDEQKNPDMQYVVESTKMVAEILHRGQLVVLESTTYPGTTRDLLLPILEKSSLICGEDFFVGYSPEREDPGRTSPPAIEVTKVVSGLDVYSAELTELLYSAVFHTIYLASSVEVAESSKLLENIYRAVNIALVNEMKVILEKLDIDIWDVIEAASTKPYGFTPFHPGPGLGGHCIPIDPFYMSWKALQAGTETRFIELAGEINRNMPHIIVEKVLDLLRDISNPKVLVLGVAYKPNVDDIREAPSAEIITQLQAKGITTSFHDPHCPIFPAMKMYDIQLESVQLTKQVLSGADVVLVVTDHSAIDWGYVGEHATLVVDTRNVMSSYPKCNARIVRA